MIIQISFIFAFCRVVGFLPDLVQIGESQRPFNVRGLRVGNA